MITSSTPNFQWNLSSVQRQPYAQEQYAAHKSQPCSYHRLQNYLIPFVAHESQTMHFTSVIALTAVAAKLASPISAMPQDDPNKKISYVVLYSISMQEMP